VGEIARVRERKRGWVRTNPFAEPAFTTEAEKKHYSSTYAMLKVL